MPKKTDKITVYYDREKCDLKGLLKKLKEAEGEYYGRSESDIVRIILSRVLPKEVEQIEGLFTKRSKG